MKRNFHAKGQDMNTRTKLFAAGLLLAALTGDRATAGQFVTQFAGAKIRIHPGRECGIGPFARVDQAGRLWTSNDRQTWTLRQPGFRTYIRSVVSANGLLIAVGGSYVDEPGVILTSRDGVTWIRCQATTKANLYGVAAGNGIFV